MITRSPQAPSRSTTQLGTGITGKVEATAGWSEQAEAEQTTDNSRRVARE